MARKILGMNRKMLIWPNFSCNKATDFDDHIIGIMETDLESVFSEKGVYP